MIRTVLSMHGRRRLQRLCLPLRVGPAYRASHAPVAAAGISRPPITDRTLLDSVDMDADRMRWPALTKTDRKNSDGSISVF